ncbi:MAG: uroporphyrinogen decarboxylase family protein [Anaerolineae bacterium]
MSSRRRVREALAHRRPERVPFAWNFGPTPEMAEVLTRYLAERGVDWPALCDAVDDIRQIEPEYIGPELPPNTDIWGIVRKPQSYGTGSYDEIAHFPLAGVTDPAVVRDYVWPDPALYDYEGFRAQVLAGDRIDEQGGLRARKLAISTCGNPFEIYCWMTGLEEAFVNVLLQPEVVDTALAHITAFFAAKMGRALIEVADLVDILYFADDLGGQRTLLMSPRTYREVLKPYHAELFRLGKRLAPDAAVMFHTDGAVFDILPDLIDAGVEVLEAVQTDAAGMAPERLKTAFGDCLAFHGGIPVQSLLPHGDTREVARACRRLVEVLGEGGGYIAAPTHAIQVGTPPENVLAMLRAVLGEADYAAALRAARMPPRSASLG